MMAVLALALIALAIPCLSGDLSYRLELTVLRDGEGWAIRGREVVSGRLPEGEGELVFRFYQGYNAPFDVLSARDGDGELPVYVVDPATFSVVLPPGRGQTFSVTLDYSAGIPPFPGGGYGTLSAAERAIVVAQGYPLLCARGEGWVIEPVLPWGDRVVAEVADYTVAIEHPEGWTVVATGEELRGPGRTEVRGENLREFAFVLVRDYARASLTPGETGVRITSWYPEGLSGAGERALELSAGALEVYEELFGDYPFPELDVVAVPLEGAAGVEFPGLILAGLDHYRSDRGLIFPMIFAHEVAHQWWYAQVGSDQVREPWVDEALATYASGLVMRRWGLFPELLDYWERTYELGRSRNPGATPFDPLWRFPGGAGYGGIVYSGGALFLMELEGAMGLDRLLGVLRRYLREHRWGIATGAELMRLLAEEGGGEAEGIIAAWRRGGRP